jgi:hypothetical protein
MTLMAIITVNVILAALVVYGIVLLLHHGIRSDVEAIETRLKAELHHLPSRNRDRLAA